MTKSFFFLNIGAIFLRLEEIFMAGKRGVSRSSGKGVTDAIFEGLLGGIIKALSGLIVKFGGVVIIIAAIIYFIVS